MLKSKGLGLEIGLIAFQVFATTAIAITGYNYLTLDASPVGDGITNQMRTSYQWERETAQKAYEGRNKIAADSDRTKVGDAAVLRSRLESTGKEGLLWGLSLAMFSWAVPELLVMLVRAKLVGAANKDA